MRPAIVIAAALAVLAPACTKTGPQQCPSLERPSARSHVGAVLVPATNEIYALGGQGAQLPLDELWRYSFGACGGWTRLVLASSPGPRANYAAALDDMRSRIIFIGGGTINDVWSLDTDRLTFTKLAAVGTPPPVAASEVAVYDAMHDRVVYAGIETYGLEFGGSDQGQWVFVDPMSLKAPASGALDPTRSLLVAYDSAGLHGFDLLTSTWHDIAIGINGAPPVTAELVWDDAGSQLLAVAADSVYTVALDANGTVAAFTPLATTNAPPPRTSFAVAVSGTTLWLSGGVTAAGCTLDDLWTLDLDTAAWTNVWPATTCL
ncbi:MAG TPA: kelch repeat-containing protein [Polyangia bacterium]|nr:kelch repeat-containing protein [Polyangia bacterium]